MAKESISIQLYDADVTDLLNGWAPDIALPRNTPDHQGVFENLQEQELIYTISTRNYSKAYRLLKKLDHLLSPQDAMAACLCALDCTTNLMNALLKHCPPIPEFQFQGVGQVSSLLVVAARHDKNKMLDLLLNRGADPNGGPTPLTAKSPLEEAFCANAYCSLNRLLEDSRTKVLLTEAMLSTWGALRTEDPSSQSLSIPFRWNCQLLLDRLTSTPISHFGASVSIFDPLPIPKELQLGHALRHDNPELALRVCQIRDLTEADIADLEAHFACNGQFQLLSEDSWPTDRIPPQQYADLLVHVLGQFPDKLNSPALRTALATTALSLPHPDARLQRWIAQMEAGPISIAQLPTDTHLSPNVFQPFAWWRETTVDKDFFPRWDARLGSHLIPQMDIHANFCLEAMEEADIRRIMERISFVGTPSPDAISPVAMQLMLHVPEDLVPPLFRPNGLLTKEQPRLLLDACQNLPLSRRNLITPLIRKDVDYTL